MRTLTIATLVVLASGTASAATVSGIPTTVTIYNSGNGSACEITIGGVDFILDDVAGNFGATCLGATLARTESKSITLSYYGSGGNFYAYGIYSGITSSSIDYIYTNDYTGTSSADQCKVYLNGSSGSAWYYVDDGNPEEDLTCGAFFAMQFSGRSWTVGYSGSEITSVIVK